MFKLLNLSLLINYKRIYRLGIHDGNIAYLTNSIVVLLDMKGMVIAIYTI